MKAIRVHQFGGPEVLKLEEVADPQPGPAQVVVRVHAAGVNPVEAYVRTGTYASKPNLPYTPGSDAAGVVTVVGADVTRVRVGERVYTTGSRTGTYAEQAVCDETLCIICPTTSASNRVRRWASRMARRIARCSCGLKPGLARRYSCMAPVAAWGLPRCN